MLVATNPRLRESLSGLSNRVLIRRCAQLDPAPPTDATTAAAWTLRLLAHRIGCLTQEIDDLNANITAAVTAHTPPLLACNGVGPDTAATLLITAGDNPQRLGSEASFAALCGVSPVEASSGKTQRRRLNRGGDRQANAALYRVALSRLRWDQRTQADYRNRRTAEGKTPREAIRCLIGGVSSPRPAWEARMGGPHGSRVALVVRTRGRPRCLAAQMASLSAAAPGRAEPRPASGSCPARASIRHRRPGLGPPHEHDDHREQERRSMCVGWDWARTTHDVTVIDEAGTMVDHWTPPPTEAGLADTLVRLASHARPDELPVAMAIEQSGGLLVERLLAAGHPAGHPVVAIHARAFHAARPRWGAAGAKSDPGDRDKLADDLRTDGHRLRRLPPWTTPPASSKPWCGSARTTSRPRPPPA